MDLSGTLDKLACMTSWLQPAQTSWKQLHFLLSLSVQKSESTKSSSSFWPAHQHQVIIDIENTICKMIQPHENGLSQQSVMTTNIS